MKKYDRETKKWVDEKVLEKRYNERDKKLCKGKREHDFVLVLPTYVKYNETYKFNPEEYYKLEEELWKFTLVTKEKINALGVMDRVYYGRPSSKYYMCSVCKKIKYD